MTLWHAPDMPLSLPLLSYLPCIYTMRESHVHMRQTTHTTPGVNQVIATFLQFDAATLRELQAARQRKGAAQRGLIGRASLLFSQR